MRKKLLILAVFATVIFTFTKFAISAASSEKKKNAELFRQVELLSDTLSIVQSDYVEEIKSKDLIYGALKGMLSSLDPHSQFMDPDTYNELKVDTEGKFGGLGIEITLKDSLLTVVTPIEDTPAWKAGIKANDRIVKINTELTRDMTLTEAVKKLRGKAGETVDITVLRESEKKLLEFKLVRDIIKIQDVKSARILENGIGYIRIIEFRENTSDNLDKALQKLKKEGMNSLILDLRNNPGGLLESAVEVTEKFIPKGKLIVSTKGRIASQNMELLSQYTQPIWDTPLVILINEGSASGSEIVAAALQDYKRAVIMGTKSFGKGSVQTVIPLNDGSALRLTTSKYFTPSNKVIHGIGVMPDIIVSDGKIIETISNKSLGETKAQDIFDEIEKKEQLPSDKEQLNYKSDNQLIRAVDVLKAIKIIKAEQKDTQK